LENSATLAAQVAGEPHSAQNRRLRAVIRPWLTPKVIAGGAIVLILLVVGLLAPVIAPYDPCGPPV
jgi:ABC-type dipeptide/oligopeptide/nickel transport system permease subunit